MRVFFTKEDFARENGGAGSPLPFSDRTAVLRDSVRIGKLSSPSRIVYQPMEGCDGETDGSPGPLTVRRYERFAAGGPGVIWFEAVAVLREGRANPRQLMLTEKNKDAFSRLVEKIKDTAVTAGRPEPLVIMQATHSGRYSKPDGIPEPLVAYRLPALEKNVDTVTTVDDEYLDRVCEAIVFSSRLAESVGFDGVDVKCCHRYLLSELLSARERPGKYGGELENRSRLLLDAVSGVRAGCRSRFEVATRMNVYDGAEIPGGFGAASDGSFDPEEPGILASLLVKRGVSLINVTMGNPYFNPHVNRPFSAGAYDPPESPLSGVARLLSGAEAVKHAAGGAAVVASGFSFLGAAAPNVAAAFAERGSFDLCGFGRAAIAYPGLASDILENGEMKKEKLCLCCSKCTEIMRKPGGTPGCAVRDAEKYLPIYREFCGEGK